MYAIFLCHDKESNNLFILTSSTIFFWAGHDFLALPGFLLAT